jgi:hypothetical protein
VILLWRRRSWRPPSRNNPRNCDELAAITSGEFAEVQRARGHSEGDRGSDRQEAGEE